MGRGVDDRIEGWRRCGDVAATPGWFDDARTDLGGNSVQIQDLRAG